MAQSPAIPQLYDDKGEVEWDWTDDLSPAERERILQIRKHNRRMLQRLKGQSILKTMRERVKQRS